MFVVSCCHAVRFNPLLHPTCYSGLRPLPQAGELKRQASHHMHRALFVCGQNRLRSPTAEQTFSNLPGIECASAGVHESANVPLDPELIEWADVIYAMEPAHRNRIQKKFRKYLKGKRIIVLDIPDEYEYMDPALVARLERAVAPLLAKHVAHED